MTDPVSRQIGTISRLRNRSTTSPLSRCTTRPLCSSTPCANPCFSSRCLQPVARTGRVAEAELLDRLRRDAALGELRARARAGRRRELLAEVRRRDLVHLEQRLAQRRVAPRVVAVALGRLGQRDAELLREHPHRVLEADLLVQLEELEDVAADAAAEAVEEPLVGIDVERRRLLGVKRTAALVRRARALQRHVLLHDLHDVRLQAEVVDELLGKQTHHAFAASPLQSFSSTTVTPPPPCSGGAVANRATSGCCCRKPASARFS